MATDEAPLFRAVPDPGADPGTTGPPPPRDRAIAPRRPAVGPLDRLMGAVVPSVVDSVDIDELVSRIDLDALVERLDVDALVDRIDVTALVARVDPDALLARVDPDTLLDRIDVNRLLDRVTVDDVLDRVDVDRLLDRVGVDRLLDRVDVDRLMGRVDVDALLDRLTVDALVDRLTVDRLLDRVDVDALLDRIDPDRLLDRVDPDRLLARLDVDGVVRRVDMDALVQRVDVDALVDRVDIDRVVERADLGGIVAQSTRGITASTLDLVRRQVVGVDEVVTRVVARVAGRDPDTDPDGPPALATDQVAARRGREDALVSGHYAGPVARAAALALDVFALFFTFGLGTALGTWVVGLLLGSETDLDATPVWSSILLAVWAVLWFAVPLAVAGRTVGKAVVGLRVVRRDGSPLRPGQALLRVLALPLSFGLFGLGLVGAVAGRERRALHDVVARSTEVIDWGDRPAELPAPLSSWLGQRRDVTTVVPPADPLDPA